MILDSVWMILHTAASGGMTRTRGHFLVPAVQVLRTGNSSVHPLRPLNLPSLPDTWTPKEEEGNLHDDNIPVYNEFGMVIARNANGTIDGEEDSYSYGGRIHGAHGKILHGAGQRQSPEPPQPPPLQQFDGGGKYGHGQHDQYPEDHVPSSKEVPADALGLLKKRTGILGRVTNIFMGGKEG
jgi:hypothetical protein